MEILEKHGVSTLRHKEFTDFDEAIAHAKTQKKAYVIKPLGEVQNIKRLLYVGQQTDGSDVIDVLRAYKKAWGHRMKGFQLQERVSGVEVAVCGFFNGQKFIEPINLNFEHKKLFNNNIGPSTGEMGTSMFWCPRNNLFNRTLGKLEEWLAKEGYVGSVDLNCIVNVTGIHPLEFTPRFGFPTIMLQAEGMTTPVGEFFHALANGKDPNLRTHRGYQIGVRICVPPFPFHDEATFEKNSRNAAIVYRGENKEDLQIQDTKNVDGQWRVAGDHGVVLFATGKGGTMAEARAQAYRRVANVIIPNMYYRTDIGYRWIEGDGDKLQAWGYLGP
jgi:phosphoribosylamine--glycine ligase